LDDTSRNTYVNFLTGNTYQKSTEETEKLIQQLAVETAQARGLHEIMAPRVSKRSIGRLEAECETITKNSESVTIARQVATSDVRNAVTFGAMNAVMAPKTCQYLTANMDSTQFAVGYFNGKKLEVKFIGELKGSLKSNPARGDHSSGLAYFIKVYIAITAFGHQCSPVYVVADDTMPAGDFDAHLVNGIGSGTDVGSVGHVVFCKTRVPPASFYQWYDREVLFKFFDNIRETYNISDDVVTWYQLDGEQNQVEGYADPVVQELYRSKNIVVGKPSGSTTSITQAIDAGAVIKVWKQKLKAIKDADVLDNTSMITVLKDVVAQHDKYMDAQREAADSAKRSDSCGKRKKKTGVSYAHRKMIALGILRIQLAMQNAVKPQTIKDSFKVTGTYPPNFNYIAQYKGRKRQEIKY
jgi:hypothetical protein